jgi:hypothetical protein
MSAPFDLAGLWEGAMRIWLAATGQAGIDHATADQLATDYLRTRIEAAFVPVETVATVDAALARATARAEAAEAVSDDVHKALWAAEARNKVLEEAVEVLRKEATMLCQNAMACAVNHYGEDFAQHGMPGWLADSQIRIQSAAQALGGEHER